MSPARHGLTPRTGISLSARYGSVANPAMIEWSSNRPVMAGDSTGAPGAIASREASAQDAMVTTRSGTSRSGTGPGGGIGRRASLRC